jgi:solute carrier family 25 protein 44
MSSLDWNEIDKTRFFGLGTLWYSGLTVTLHPLTVLKTRQQVLRDATVSSLYQEHGLRGLYRGVGTVVCLSVPARVLYLFVLESSRQTLKQPLQSTLGLSPVAATSLAGGIAGGVAAVATQSVIVPMDVISQRQMLTGASARSVMQAIGQEGGSIFRGFGLSILTSLPAGTVWWSVYSACQHSMSTSTSTSTSTTNGAPISMRDLVMAQVVSGVAAGVAAAFATQPLDVIKTRLQVDSHKRVSYTQVVRQLLLAAQSTTTTTTTTSSAVFALSGFYRGILPRMGHMSVWGTCLSGLYELLRYVSRIDYSPN